MYQIICNIYAKGINSYGNKKKHSDGEKGHNNVSDHFVLPINIFFNEGFVNGSLSNLSANINNEIS